MGRALSLSFAAHAVFVVSFLLLSATRQPLPIPPAVRPIRLVTYLEPAAAPRTRAPGMALPASTRRTPPAAAPATPAQPTTEAAAPVAVPRLAVPVPMPAPPASPPAPTEARPALSERLARRLASAEPAHSEQEPPPQVTSLPRQEQPPPAVDPAVTQASATPAIPYPAAGTVVPIGDFPHAWYLGILKEKIYSRWTPPSDYFKSSRPPTALVAFRIDRGGRLHAITLKERSGSSRFDQSALAAVEKLGQVPALPDDYEEETLDVVIRFQNQK